MSLSRSPSAYLDVKAVLDQALAMGGARYRLLTKPAATHWRMRAYMYRSILLELDNEVKKRFGLLPATIYDPITMSVEATEVVIRVSSHVEGHLVALNGASVERPVAKMEEDELLEAAKRMAAGLTGE